MDKGCTAERTSNTPTFEGSRSKGFGREVSSREKVAPIRPLPGTGGGTQWLAEGRLEHRQAGDGQMPPSPGDWKCLPLNPLQLIQLHVPLRRQEIGWR